ncbi:metallophosphoesterase [Pseudactinotalea sp. Z1739]|uniref:metallophosphoesterase n=1 Tax=Pseudactinotalea sp. Z1739 TaxID=3413028 RepID=UPI003C7E2CDA
MSAGSGVLAWSLIEAHWYALRRVQVPVLPVGSDPVRLLHISDLHLLPGDRRRIAWVRALAGLRPDLVINTGDNMAHARALPAVLEALGPLLGAPGAFVMGSNDYYAPVPKNPLRYLRPRRAGTPPSAPRLPGEELGAALRAHGWSDLTNRRDRLRLGDLDVALVGVDDPHLHRDELPPPDPTPSTAFTPADPTPSTAFTPADPTPSTAFTPADPTPSTAAGEPEHARAVLRLGVTHAPYARVLRAMRADGTDMVLAGHTHGGQVCVPGYGALVTNCDLPPAMAKGLHAWPGDQQDQGAGSIWLHVSAGLGTSPFTPVRLACRPEATLLTLVPRAGSPSPAG